jgi:hypothetical protein
MSDNRDYRWNFEDAGAGQILRCENNHDKGEKCYYELMTVEDAELMTGKIAKQGVEIAELKSERDELRAQVAELKASAVVPVAHIKWSNHKQSNDEIRYDHVIGKTPFGNFQITWKSWKESDCPTVDETPWGDFFGAYVSVDEAKSACEAEYKKRIEQCFQQEQES